MNFHKGRLGGAWATEEHPRRVGERRNIEIDWQLFCQASLETGLDKTDASIANIVRLLKFIPGKTFYEIGTQSHLSQRHHHNSSQGSQTNPKPSGTWSTDHFLQCGEFIARMDNSLKCFTHTAYQSRLRTEVTWPNKWRVSNSITFTPFTFIPFKRLSFIQELNLVSELDSWGEEFHRRCARWRKEKVGEICILALVLNKEMYLFFSLKDRYVS